jgi:glutaredoxin-related protein/virulence-associated protein VagC
MQGTLQAELDFTELVQSLRQSQQQVAAVDLNPVLAEIRGLSAILKEADLSGVRQELHHLQTSPDTSQLLQAVNNVKVDVDLSEVTTAVRDLVVDNRVDMTPVLMELQQLREKVDNSPILKELRDTNVDVDISEVLKSVELQVRGDLGAIVDELRQVKSSMDFSAAVQEIQTSIAKVDITEVLMELRNPEAKDFKIDLDTSELKQTLKTELLSAVQESVAAQVKAVQVDVDFSEMTKSMENLFASSKVDLSPILMQVQQEIGELKADSAITDVIKEVQKIGADLQPAVKSVEEVKHLKQDMSVDFAQLMEEVRKVRERQLGMVQDLAQQLTTAVQKIGADLQPAEKSAEEVKHLKKDMSVDFAQLMEEVRKVNERQQGIVQELAQLRVGQTTAAEAEAKRAASKQVRFAETVEKETQEKVLSEVTKQIQQVSTQVDTLSSKFGTDLPAMVKQIQECQKADVHVDMDFTTILDEIRKADERTRKAVTSSHKEAMAELGKLAKPSA